MKYDLDVSGMIVRIREINVHMAKIFNSVSCSTNPS